MSESAKSRQATRRAKMAKEGKKDVTMSAVKIEHIEPLKEAIMMLETGEAILHKGKIVKPVNDKREETRLSNELSKAQAEVKRLKIELGKAQRAYEVQAENTLRADTGRERAIKTAEKEVATRKQLESELARFESVLWGFYRKR